MIDLSLLPDFIAETGEHLEEMESCLLQLESEPDNLDVLNDIFRSIHTIKGSAEFVGLERVAELSHKLENVLDRLRQGEKTVNTEIVDTLIEAKDRIELLVKDLEQTQKEKTEISDLLDRIKQVSGDAGEQESALKSQESNGEDYGEAGEELETTDASEDKIKQVSGYGKERDEVPALKEPVDETDSETAESLETIDESENKIQDESDGDEDYEEEYDKELFEIFLEQLKESISFIKTQTALMEDSDSKIDLFNKCADSISRLKSSANYMGYENLISIYDQWLSEIMKVQEGLMSGEDISTDFMSDYLNKILERFPLAEKEEVKEGGGSKDQEKEQSRVHDHQDLYDKLGAAFDSSMAPNDDCESDLTEEEMEEALFSGKKPDSMQLPLIESTHKADDETDDVEEMLFRRDESILQDQAPTEITEGEPEKSEKDIDLNLRSEIDDEEIVQDEIVDQRKEDRRTEGRRTEDRRLFDRRKSDTSGVVKQSVRVDAGKIDSLMNQVGELVVSRAFFSQIFNEMRELQQHLKEDVKLDQREMKPVRELAFKLSEATVGLGRVTNELQEGVMKVRMLPISQLFNRYPRLVRDLVHDTDKQVQLEIRGEETELDKMIIEEISDPLIHIIRNAIDHGFETVNERKGLGKPKIGTLVLEAYHESNHIVIEITDDGKGLDAELIRTRAVEKKFFTKEEIDRMAEKELTRIVMMPGFSTAKKVTHTSGRGVGMDVVKKNIEKLNGTIEINSKSGKQMQIRMKIPLTLAIIPALLVRLGKEIFTIPLATVEETLRIFEHETSTIEGVEVIHLRDSTMPIFRLSELFGITPENQDENKSFVVIVSTGMQKIGLVVDELMGQQEVVIKPLEDYLQENSGFSGATIIGDGQISLILDVYELVNMTAGRQVKRQKELSFQRIAERNDGGEYLAPVTVH